MPEIKPSSSVTMAIAASALRAEQARMRVIAENLANANSTGRTPGADPYRRQVPVFKPEKMGGATGVRFDKAEPDQSDFKTAYDPGHPAADVRGYVKLPNVDSLIEGLDMREAQRAYEANLNVIDTARAVQQRTLDLLRR